MPDSPAAERILDEAGVRALVRAVAPALAELPLIRVAEGWDNVTWRLGDDLAVRMPRRALAVPLIEHEQHALPLLTPALSGVGVRTPLPLVVGAPTAEFPWPWSLLPWLPGRQALGLPRADNTSWAGDLAVALRALHVPAPDDAPHNPVRGVPLSHREDSVRARLADLPPSIADPLERIWRSGLAAAPATESVWIHGDLHPGNILVDGGRLSALIDFGDVTAGDPAYDLAAGWLAFDAEGRQQFRRAAGDRYDEQSWVRARAWAAAIAAILAHASDDRDDLRTLGFETAEELLKDE
ncbi:aminoglycoside phosphotransferase family protein [Microbacterium sp. EST19A]|uniref:aminoglycoside phosphotransferase family protein n=1 Tax=Microbacterium sp. EST19A TaxID=2862681 RepID=UPI001CC1A161|nr:aminoglycoside phosphotransferase family protein [Microbacterium sp. EST19A]